MHMAIFPLAGLDFPPFDSLCSLRAFGLLAEKLQRRVGGYLERASSLGTSLDRTVMWG